MRVARAAAIAAMTLVCCTGTEKPDHPVVTLTTTAAPYTRAALIPIDVAVALSATRVELLRDGRVEAVLDPPTGAPGQSAESYRFSWDASGAPDGTVVWLARALVQGVWLESPPLAITIDRTPPGATLSAPAGAGTPVQRLDAVEIAFSEPVDVSTVLDAFEMLAVDASENVPYRAAVSADRTRLTLTPSRPLASPDRVSVRVRAPIQDRAGNALEPQSAPWVITLVSPWEPVAGGAPTSATGWGFDPTVFVVGDTLYAATAIFPIPLSRVGPHGWESYATTQAPSAYVWSFTSDGATLWGSGTSYADGGGAVVRWDAGTWTAVGAPLHADPAAIVPSAPLVGFDGGSPVATWYERVADASENTLDSTVQIAAWNGSTWASVGAFGRSAYPSRVASGPSGAYVMLSNQGQNEVLRVRNGALEPLAPLAVGLSFSSAAVTHDGRLFVAARTFAGPAYCRVLEWTGRWTIVGDVGRSYAPELYPPICEVVAMPDGRPFVAWADASSGSEPRVLHAAWWDGTRFSETWGILNMRSARDVAGASLTLDPAGRPTVGWTEQTTGVFGSTTDVPQYTVYVKTLVR